jgi:hypothetical protein
MEDSDSGVVRMTTDRIELMLEQLTKAQRQLVMWMAVGFACGFALGILTVALILAVK